MEYEEGPDKKDLEENWVFVRVSLNRLVPLVGKNSQFKTPVLHKLKDQ